MFTSPNTDQHRWKLIISYTENGYSVQNNESYFILDSKYNLSKRWQSTPLPNTPINNIKILPIDKLTINTTDSFSVVLNAAGTETFIGSLDVLSTEININNPQQYLSLKSNLIYIYEKPSGISSSIAYQSAANQYNIFINELKNMWKHQLTNMLFENIENNTINANNELDMDNMYALLKKLHKRCKSDHSLNDIQTAFNESFQHRNTNNVSNNINDDNKEKLSSGYGGMQLENALSKFKSRGIVLLIEHEIERFIKHCIKHKNECVSITNTSNEYVLLFPECNNYYRLLIDKICERFGCYTKTYGQGNIRRIFVYCRVNEMNDITVKNIPKRLCDIRCFIPILKIRDLIIFGQFNDLIDRSLKY
eukprot:516159_1